MMRHDYMDCPECGRTPGCYEACPDCSGPVTNGNALVKFDEDGVPKWGNRFVPSRINDDEWGVWFDADPQSPMAEYEWVSDDGMNHEHAKRVTYLCNNAGWFCLADTDPEQVAAWVKETK